MADVDEQVQAFFGRQLRRNVWNADDGAWGHALIEHYTTNHHDAAAAAATHSHHDDEHSSTIPRILHFIWLGPRLLDETCIDTWKQHHADWQIHVWRDDNVPQNLWNQQVFDYAMQQRLYGMASDILRLEVLWRMGGVYVDIDYLCVSSLQPLEKLDFYCGASHVGCIEVNNGVFGCRSEHNIIKSLMEEIHVWFQRHGRPLLLVSSFLPANEPTSSLLLSSTDILRHTGPGLWTKVLGELAVEEKLSKDAMIFPHSVFHPMPNWERHEERGEEDIMHQYGATSPDTKAIHLWKTSWQQQTASRRQHDNDNANAM